MEIKRNMILQTEDVEDNIGVLAKAAFDELSALIDDADDPITDMTGSTKSPLIAYLHLATQQMMQDLVYEHTQHGEPLQQVLKEAGFKMSEMLFMYGYIAGYHSIVLDTLYKPDPAEIPHLHDPDPADA